MHSFDHGAGRLEILTLTKREGSDKCGPLALTRTCCAVLLCVADAQRHRSSLRTQLTCLSVWCRASNQSRWTEEKRLRVWLPPGYDQERPPPGGWPLLIRNDGQNLFEDQWAHQARIALRLFACFVCFSGSPLGACN